MATQSELYITESFVAATKVRLDLDCRGANTERVSDNEGYLPFDQNSQMSRSYSVDLGLIR